MIPLLFCLLGSFLNLRGQILFMKKHEVIDTLSVIKKSHFQEATTQIDKDGYPGNRRAFLYNVIDPDTEEFYPPPYLIELAYKHATDEVLNDRFFAGIGIDTGHFDQLKSFGYLIEEKIDPARIDKSIVKMQDRAKLFRSLMSDTNELFKHASLDNAYIKTAVYEEKRWTPVKNYQPVVLLRHLILEQIKNNKTINEQTIEVLKQEIIKKDLGKYKLPAEYMEQVNKYPVKKRSVFHQWKSPFAIMYPLFYSKKLKQQTKEQLLNIGNLIIDRLELSDMVKKNTVGFEGAQNYGADAAWLALYPKELPSVQHAYQLFVIITKNGIEGGLYPGHKLENQDFKPKTFNFKNIEDCIDKMKSVHDEWKQLNQEIMELKNGLSNDDMAKLLTKFLEQTKTTSQKTKEYNDHKFQGLDIVAGFGKGALAKIPWIGFINSPNTIQKGIYPVFLLFKEVKKIVLAYGVSEEEDPDDKWIFESKKVKIKDWHINEFEKKPYRYGESHIHSIYDVYDNINDKQLVKDLTAIVSDYKKVESLKEDNIQQWIYSPGSAAKHWDTFYTEGIMGLGWNELGDISRFKSSDEITKELQRIEATDSSKKNDSKANWEFSKKMKPGDLVIVNRGRNKLLGYGYVSSNYYYDQNRNDHHHLREVDWVLQGEWETDFQLHGKTLTNITWDNGIDHPNYEYYHELLLATMRVKAARNKQKIIPINQILYGPPGTGKTYKLKTECFPKYTTKETTLSAEKNFEQVVSKLTWFEAMALAMLEKNAPISVPALKENRWIATKAKYSENKNINASLWKQLQAHTIEDCEFVNVKNRQSPLIFKKNEDKSWEISMEDFEDLTPELSDVLEKTNNFQANPDKEIKRYEFVTFHQSYAYEDFIEGIKPVMASEGDGELRYEIKDGLFKSLCQHAKNDPENKYAIFIDEINRGNVSSIFGELITLIEPDKRLGMENAMTATLPYSRDSFGVPSNVDIYGTMNTADRSVEALDTALRRRFSFEEILPKPELLNQDIKSISMTMKEVLSCINNRIEALIDRDHTIGHSYLINVENIDELKLAFKDKIIPLLQEYFYGDYGKIGLVLGEGFVKMHPQENEIFANFEYDGSDGLAQNKFELITIDKEFKIEEALEILLNKPSE
jgi:hypothetical protein